MRRNHSHTSDAAGIDRRSVLRSSAAVGALALTGVTIGSTSAAARSEGATAPDDGVGYQYFHREWTEIEADLERVAELGVSAIWIPQPAVSKLSWENLTYEDQEGFYEGEESVYGRERDPHPPLGYQPVDLRDFDSAHGTEDELASLIETAHDHDIDVIVDIVLNHMANPDGPDGEVEYPQFDLDEHFHDYGTLGDGCELEGEEAEMYECDLLALPSLDVEHPEVREAHEAYLRKIADLGADGLRIDAAAHVWPWYFEEYVNRWADELDLWRVGEVWDDDVGHLLEFADTGMTVFDFPLYNAIMEAFEDGSMEELSQETARGVVHERPEAAVTFVQNHDTVGPEVEPNEPEGRAVELAEAFVLAYAGMPMLYRGGAEDRPELEDDDLRALVEVSRTLARGDVIDRHVDENLYVFEREGNLLAGINTTDEDRTVTVETDWRNERLADFAGDGDDVRTDARCAVEITVPAEGWVMYAPDDGVPADPNPPGEPAPPADPEPLSDDD
ncbi:alpha-amylase family glycosyl hydrolase [Natronococcus sp. A-GB1]|uniref:alpha-amylase family glycosyl hydrolase n=1 Tax=Natronococcus sp. A-GB1 TaxID=3037648 RepID=UPI00241F01E0|nr:alpha-amylase family glycosyl hydrolase [Natronococcus sp. A-GB1]MDG5758616.1 alpha-amylase family glycosyl hydrolase [Natronococcus sp. A-GB1]